MGCGCGCGSTAAVCAPKAVERTARLPVPGGDAGGTWLRQADPPCSWNEPPRKGARPQPVGDDGVEGILLLPGIGAVPRGAQSGNALLELLAAGAIGSKDAGKGDYGMPRRVRRGPTEAPHRLAPAALGSRARHSTTLPSGGNAIPPPADADPGPQVEFHYGDVHLYFPTTWFVRHWLEVKAGTAPSQDEVLDLLWPDVRSAVRAASLDGSDWAEWFLDRRVGCLNAPQSPDGWLFWNIDKGGHVAWILNTFRLLGAYVGLADDVSTGTDHGEGFTRFVDFAVTGGTGWTGADPGAGLARRSENHDENPGEWRRIRFHWRSIDWLYDGESVSDLGACGAYYTVINTDLGSEACGRAWDAWTNGAVDDCAGDPGALPCPKWSYGSAGHDCWSAGYATDWASDTSGHVTLHADILGYQAWLQDRMLTWARAAIAWYQDADSWEEAELRWESHVVPAWWLGRHLLRRMAVQLGLIIHEIGHVFNIHGHCQKHCFMDAAATRYACLLAGELGLPWDEKALRYETFGHGCYVNPGGSTSGVANEVYQGQACLSNQAAMCYLSKEGVAGAPVAFCISSAFETGGMTICRGEDADVSAFVDDDLAADIKASVAIMGCKGFSIEAREDYPSHSTCSPDFTSAFLESWTTLP